MQKVRYCLSFNNLYIKFQVLFHFSFMIAISRSFTLLYSIDVRGFSLRNWSSCVQSYNFILRRTRRLRLEQQCIIAGRETKGLENYYFFRKMNRVTKVAIVEI